MRSDEARLEFYVQQHSARKGSSPTVAKCARSLTMRQSRIAGLVESSAGRLRCADADAAMPARSKRVEATFARPRWPSREPEYACWQAIKKRCYNQKTSGYKHYGGRGITVWDGWLPRSGYEDFLAHIGRRPSPRHSIDRIDNSRGYEPGNVRWATQGEQNRNSRLARLIEFRGERLCITDWAAKLITQGALSRRLSAGWPVDKALTTCGARRSP